MHAARLNLMDCHAAGQQLFAHLAHSRQGEDASFFSRLFRRKVGLTSAPYRRRFGGPRRAPGGAAHAVAPD